MEVRTSVASAWAPWQPVEQGWGTGKPRWGAGGSQWGGLAPPRLQGIWCLLDTLGLLQWVKGASDAQQSGVSMLKTLTRHRKPVTVVPRLRTLPGKKQTAIPRENTRKIESVDQAAFSQTGTDTPAFKVLFIITFIFIIFCELWCSISCLFSFCFCLP